eukprot:m.41060 g.41060  ORF g.41060 m.41060 type:complete len:441 (+) comp10508_c0_seq2:94-1416(+)
MSAIATSTAPMVDPTSLPSTMKQTTSTVGVDPFAMVPLVEASGIFTLSAECKADRECRFDLLIGMYKNADGDTVVLDSVRDAEDLISASIQSGEQNHEYLPIEGMKVLPDLAIELLYKPEQAQRIISQRKMQGVQSLSGTGALQLAAAMCFAHMGDRDVYISNPTWPNHFNIFKAAGFSNVAKYSYYKPESKSLDFDGMCDDLESMSSGSIVVLHTCAHNPTGVDPTHAQWVKICSILKERNLVPVFDTAYLGFVTGSVQEDAFVLQHAYEQGLHYFTCISFAKMFGIYSERCGVVLYNASSSSIATSVVSNLKLIIRRVYSNPPKHGARIVSTILSSKELKAKWEGELMAIATRIRGIRGRLQAALDDVAPNHDWSHISNQRGMFSYTGLDAAQVEFLKKEHHIYCLPTGRINMSGIPETKIEELASAISESLASDPQE